MVVQIDKALTELLIVMVLHDKKLICLSARAQLKILYHFNINVFKIKAIHHKKKGVWFCFMFT